MFTFKSKEEESKDKQQPNHWLRPSQAHIDGAALPEEARIEADR